MKAKRDYSLLYGVLAGFFLCSFLFGLWFRSDTTPVPNIPIGSIYWEVDTFGGFPAEGIEMDIYHIPEDKIDEFFEQLMELGFERTPFPKELVEKLAKDPDTVMLAEVSDGLWWFRENVSIGEELGRYEDFNLSLYYAESGIYYDLLYVI